MKNTKTLLFFAIILFGCLYRLFLAPTIFAQEFTIDTRIDYDFNRDGLATVNHAITLENNTALTYAKSYTLIYENLNLTDLYISDDKQNYQLEKEEKGDHTYIKAIFPDDLVGKNAKREFRLHFTTPDLSQKTGEVWEVSIPKLLNPENYRSYNTIISVPESWGEESYISPTPSRLNKEGPKRQYLFTKGQLTQSGVVAAFGQFQVFSFHLSYHLENPITKTVYTEIAIPPDTAFQKIYYDKIDPVPESIRIDEDGNFLAKYILSPRKKLEIIASGSVQIFAKERSFPPSKLPDPSLLSPTQYWESDNQEIISLAKKYNTPKKIYDYVVGHLSYDYSRVSPTSVRLGALKVLDNPNQAICMEFTDLFIAISRAAGIFAREVNGYAYTENREIQPLSLVSDVLHSWPEYWDSARQVWVAVDPTWGNTTGGEDFFNKLDLRHFTFVNHGKSPTEPYPPGSYKLGSNPQKDIYISFGHLPEIRSPRLSISAQYNSKAIFNSQISLTILNSGPLALYDQAVEVFFDDQLNHKLPVAYLLPFSKTKLSVKIPFKLYGIGSPNKVTVKLPYGETTVDNIRQRFFLISLLLTFLLLFCILVTIISYFKKSAIKDRVLKLIYERKITSS